jgi:hypothetical protein
MAAIAFDPMEYLKQLEASGMPRSQAEAIAKGFIDMSVHNFDALVTKDYLDSRFSAFESRIDLRLAEAENRTDGKFKDLESRMDLRFVALESKMDVRFARMNVIQGVILLALVIPVLQAVLTWVG